MNTTTSQERTALRPQAGAELSYQSGFGNSFSTEALAGTLPVGRNSPQQAAHGLYTEQISGTAFTAPRDHNRRSWCYRILPSAPHKPYRQIAPGELKGNLRTAPIEERLTPPNRLRWNPLAEPAAGTDFIDGLNTMTVQGSCTEQTGSAIHLYCANASMKRRYFTSLDGEMLIVPQAGRMLFHTEMGKLAVAPGEIVVIPRGVRFRVDLLDDKARGYVCENYGRLFNLPELGPIGSNGLANARDFLAPVAAYEDDQSQAEVVQKFLGNLWSAEYDHSPLDVVAWHGNYYPYKYDLMRFMSINTVSFDHPDPSIFTVLTSPSDAPGVANMDFVVFPPRWSVADGTFRPPWFHRNMMSEFMGLINGVYESRSEGFLPGGSSLHNSFAAHGPDIATYEKASTTSLKPVYMDTFMAFMFESRYVFQTTKYAMESPALQKNYDAVWDGIKRNFRAP